MVTVLKTFSSVFQTLISKTCERTFEHKTKYYAGIVLIKAEREVEEIFMFKPLYLSIYLFFFGSQNPKLCVFRLETHACVPYILTC